jgi:hypothetical protein
LGRTVAELEETITEAELAEWMVFYHKEPFLPQRIEYSAAGICHLLAMINRDPKKGKRPKLTDFLLFENAEERRPEKVTDPDVIKNLFLALPNTKVKERKRDGNNNRRAGSQTKN